MIRANFTSINSCGKMQNLILTRWAVDVEHYSRKGPNFVVRLSDVIGRLNNLEDLKLNKPGKLKRLSA